MKPYGGLTSAEERAKIIAFLEAKKWQLSLLPLSPFVTKVEMHAPVITFFKCALLSALIPFF
jgi:hypothetical protein